MSNLVSSLLEQQNVSLERLLENEAAGMAVPLDAKYFDDFPLIYGEPVLGPSDKAGRQYPQPDTTPQCRDALIDLSHYLWGIVFGGESIPSPGSLWSWWMVP